MKIQCDNCAIVHELDPPAWVVSSGRPFRFRCSSCGHSQSVMPDTLPDETPPPPPPPAESVRPSPAASSASSGHGAPPVRDPTPGPTEDSTSTGEGAVFLKQNGQIYMVRDWDTLKRWIGERRVDRHDLVSEGGVRWDPIGSRSDLAHLFGPTLAPAPEDIEEDDDDHPMSEQVLRAPAPVPETEPVDLGASMPFEMPFMGASTGAVLHGAWHDDDTEGIPTGLPALPRQLGPGKSGGRPRTETPEPSDHADLFGDNPTYALPPPSMDTAMEEERAATRAGGMTYVAPEGDTPLPPPSLSEIPTVPPKVQMPSAFFDDEGSPGDGWDELVVGDEETPALPLGDTPDVSSTRPHPYPEVSAPSMPGSRISAQPPPTPMFPHEEDSFVDNLMARDIRRVFFGVGMALMGMAVVATSMWYVLRDAPPRGPITETEAELGTVLPDDSPKPRPTPVAEPAEPAPTASPEPETDGTAQVDVAPEPRAVPEPAPEPAPEPQSAPDPQPEPSPLPPPQPQPDPAPQPPPAPEPAPQPEPQPQPQPEPQPQPVAAPAPAPTEPPPPSLGQLVNKGWAMVESDPKGAADLFEQALQLHEANVEANYGFGYAHLQMGDKARAQSHLCRAYSEGTVDVRREVKGLLDQNQLGCD